MLKQSIRVHLRWCIRRDLPEVLEIDQAGYDSSWNEEDFCHYQRQRNQIGMVAELGEKVVGYAMYGLYAGKIKLDRLAVHPFYRRQGVGTQMVQKLLNKLSISRRKRLVAVVPEMALAAQMLLKGQGFRAIKVLPDGYLMRYKLSLEWTVEEILKREA